MVTGQREKLVNEQLTTTDRSRSDNGGRSTTPDNTKLHSTGARRSPSFTRTRSDEPIRAAMKNIVVSTDNSVGGKLMESTSEETLVGSSSHQDLHASRYTVHVTLLLDSL